MSKRRVPKWGFQKREFVTIDDEATKGGIIGDNVYNSDGTLFDPEETVAGLIEQTSSSGQSVASTIWRLILEIPTNIVSLAALSGIGFATRISSAGAWANRVITGTFGRIDITDGNGVSGNPTIDLGPWPIVKNSISSGLEYAIPEGYQLIVYDSFDIVGTLDINGDLVIL